MAEGMLAEQERRFWDGLIQRLHKQGIRPPFDRWYVVRAEQFTRAFPGRRLAEITAGEVTDYLTGIGHDTKLKPWQFEQVVAAIQTLYSMVNTAWFAGFDWQLWKDSARSLESQHATTAREALSVSPRGSARGLPAVHYHPHDLRDGTLRLDSRVLLASCNTRP
ncbi:MAG: hypothetical protein AB7U81_05625 [Thiohalomonadaceae bacterium]